MTDHFKRTIRLLAAIGLLLVGGYFWIARHIRDIAPRQALPANDRELISYNENRHELTITTPNGTTREYSRNPIVELRKDGTARVDAHKWGPELRPFLGVGYSDTGRAYAGCQFFYFHGFDAGASLGWTADANRPALQPMLAVGYNFWGNTSLNVGLNPAPIVLNRKTEIAVFLSVRL